VIIPTHATKNPFKQKILELVVSVEVIIIIIIFFNIIYQLQNNKERMAFTDRLWGHFRFKATEICTAAWGPTVWEQKIELFVFYAKTKAK